MPSLIYALIYFDIYGWYGVVHGIYLLWILWTFMDCPWQHLTTLSQGRLQLKVSINSKTKVQPKCNKKENIIFEKIRAK